MKKPTSTALVPDRTGAPAKPKLAEPTAMTVRLRVPLRSMGKTPGARINAWHKLAIDFGKSSIAAGIMAGWELSQVRKACNHGQWLDWLRNNTVISDRTAERYMSVFARTIGAARTALPNPVPMEVQPSLNELEAVCADVDAKSISALYAQLRLLKRSENHGGVREGAGRKPKAAPGTEEDVAAQLEAVASAPALLWAAAKDAVDKLAQLDAERDFLSRLETGDLATFVNLLVPLAQKAAALLSKRLGAADGAVERFGS